MSIDKEYRQVVITHLKYIKEKVDANNARLQTLNGRVRNTEIKLSWFQGIGAGVTFILSSVIAYLFKN